MSDMLFPAIEPYCFGSLRVSEVHTLYFELSGNKNGSPVVFLHGGPGLGTTPEDRRFFDPAKYMIILFDQRGAGRSTVNSEDLIKDNTLMDLINDMELIRTIFVGIDKPWHIFGGGWGSTLALAYAQAHPGNVNSLVLRGIFLGRSSELDFFRFLPKGRAQSSFPEQWAAFIAPVDADDRSDLRLMNAYYHIFRDRNIAEEERYAHAWVQWVEVAEKITRAACAGCVCNQYFPPRPCTCRYAAIMSYYLVTPTGVVASTLGDGQLLDQGNIDRIRDIPTTIVHGQDDLLFPVTTAQELQNALPSARLHIVPGAGHSAFQKEMTRLLIQATNEAVDRST
ncbi:proline iminopeptidase [Lyophyllum atratum]|nr:proline iminopeptidase [Lyophyllum atratum]